MLDCLHYDFNTCLCESEIILKSFLRALPAEQLAAFVLDLDSLPAEARVRRRLRERPHMSRATA
jgi:hypothetical protein